MSRLDIRIKAGTKIIVDYGDGMTITHETVTDTDIDHLYDTLARLEEIERIDASNRAGNVEICGAELNADSRPCQSERGHSGDHWTPSDQADKPRWWSTTGHEIGRQA